MITSDPRYDFDFAVAGGGPAGSSAAISLRQRGHSVVLFERETFPRFHIGESLLSTANDAFAALGVAKQIEAASFPAKWGARLSRMMVRMDDTLTSPAFEKSRGLRRIKFAARNLIAFYWNGLAKWVSMFEKRAT